MNSTVMVIHLVILLGKSFFIIRLNGITSYNENASKNMKQFTQVQIESLKISKYENHEHKKVNLTCIPNLKAIAFHTIPN